MVLAIVHVLEEPAVLDRFAGVPRARREILEVALEVLEVRALDAARSARKAEIHDLVVEAHDLEELRASIARDRRDAHLRHDLEEALANAAAVTAAELEPRVRVHLDAALLHHVEERLVRHVRIHGRRAEADETGEMMRIARRAGLDQDVALGAHARLDESMVHGARDE